MPTAPIGWPIMREETDCSQTTSGPSFTTLVQHSTPPAEAGSHREECAVSPVTGSCCSTTSSAPPSRASISCRRYRRRAPMAVAEPVWLATA